MKTTIIKYVVGAVMAGLALTPAAFAKKKPANLSAFAGRYTGTVSFLNLTEVETGTATVTITVPKNGKSAIIEYTATVSDNMGNTTVLPTEITLASDKSIFVTDIGVGVAGTNNAHKASGTYTQHKKTLTMFATNGDTNFNVSGFVKDVRKKRKLSLNLVSADAMGGSTYTFTTTLVAKLPKIHH